ncbi:MAG: alpha/beta hydrolase [Burkholderiaceae bacterium]
MTITEHTVKSDRHTTHYLAAGPEHGPLMVFVHGWPELAISWRHQLPVFAALGFHCIAPDMRGYGRSSVHERLEDYAQREIVADMIELLDHLGRGTAVWVGHDWGSAVVWSIASHHPERCAAVASLCVPYATLERGLDALIATVDRSLYPADQYPAGQWDYMCFYEESFEQATRHFEADPVRTVKALFRGAAPDKRGRIGNTAVVRRNGGWFGPAGIAPDLPLDARVLTEADLLAYAAALSRNGFFGPDAWYMNHARNVEFAREARHGGRLAMPVLFIGASCDYVCETVDSDLAGAMGPLCADLSTARVDSGHWMAQEKPVEVNAILCQWLATRVTAHWPGQGICREP